MFDRVLLDNEDWRITMGLTGIYKVLWKIRGVVRKVSREESRHFLRVVESASDLGIPIEPGNQNFQSLASDFAEALVGNGDVLYRAYFSSLPHELVK